MKKFVTRICLVFLLVLVCSACVPASYHSDQLHSNQEREMTLGVVQKEITKGMSQADVAQALGSPNMVTRDKEGLETWIYDKIATEVSYSKSQTGAGVGGLLIGGAGALFGGASGSHASGAAAQTQKTLTVIIKFAENVVSDYSYHSSKF